MNKVVFLDRDGTINVEKNYLYKWEDFEFEKNAVDALRLFQQCGYLLIIVTNQSGIARGLYTENDFFKLTGKMLNKLSDEGINITNVYYCPHHPEAVVEKYKKICSCRKPEIGLFKRAIREYDIDLSKSYALGDRLRDCKICFQSKCTGFLIGKNEKIEIIEKVKKGEFQNILYSDNILDAAKLICGKSELI